MKCKKCHKKIKGKDMRFCPYCGSELTIETSNNNVGNEERIQKEVIKIGNDEIAITKYMQIECRELMYVISLADSCAKNVESYYQKAGSLDKGIEVLKTVIEQSYIKIAQEIINIESNCSFKVDINGKQLWGLSSKYIHSLRNIFFISEAKSLALKGEQEYNQFTRELNKESRFRIIGGGFGIEGAIKGMAIAGAANLTTGAFYSLFNGIKEIGDNLSADSDKRSLYNDLKKQIYVAVYNDVVQLYYFLNYLIGRPMIYTLNKENVRLFYSYNKKNIKTRNDALKLIKDYPYLVESYKIASTIIDESDDLLNFANKIGNSDAVEYLEKYIKIKNDVKAYLKEDTNKYIKLFISRPFFGKLIYSRKNVVDGVDELGKNIKKILKVKLDYSQMPYEIGDDEFFVCCFKFDSVYIIWSNKYIYCGAKSETMRYSSVEYFSYKMSNKNCADIFINGKPSGHFFINEDEASDVIDCFNYILLKIKYNIPTVFPDNIKSVNDEYRNKLYTIFENNTEYIIKKYKKYHCLDMFIEYGNIDILEALEKEMDKTRGTKQDELLRHFYVGDYVYLETPFSVNALNCWVESYGYVFDDEYAICYVDREFNNRTPEFYMTTNRLYYEKSVDNKNRLYYLNYSDVESIEYKYITSDAAYLGPEIRINGSECKIHVVVDENSGALLYQWILYIILNIKYNKKVITKRALRIDDYKNELEKEAKENKKSGCFITTATCLSLGKGDDCLELNLFRKFRDEWLMYQKNGKILISEYYKIAPIIVSSIEKKDNKLLIYKSIWNKYLQKCLKYIRNGEYELCKITYMKMVNDLFYTFGHK